MGMLKNNQYYSVDGFVLDKKSQNVSITLGVYTKKDGNFISNQSFFFLLNDQYEFDEKTKKNKKIEVYNEYFGISNINKKDNNIIKQIYRLIKERDESFGKCEEV